MVAFPWIRKGSRHDAENRLWDGSSPQHPSRQLSCRSRPANRWGLCCDFCFVPNGVSRNFSDLAEGWGLGRFAGFAARAKSPPFAASRAPGPRGPGRAAGILVALLAGPRLQEARSLHHADDPEAPCFTGLKNSTFTQCSEVERRRTSRSGPRSLCIYRDRCPPFISLT